MRISNRVIAVLVLFFIAISLRNVYYLYITQVTGAAAQSNATISLRVVNAPPQILAYYPLINPNITEEESQLFYINFTDPEGEDLTVTWRLNNIIINQTIKTLHPGTGYINSSEYNFTANYSSAGSYQVEVTVSDSYLSTVLTWTLNVTNVNRPPYFNITIEDIAWEQGSTYTMRSLDYYVIDPDLAIDDSVSYEYTFVTIPNYIQVGIDSITHEVLFNPALNFLGTEVLYFKVTDSEGAFNYSNNVSLTIRSRVYPPPPRHKSKGKAKSYPCENYWHCGPWSKCYPENNTQARKCIDLAQCTLLRNRPPEIQNCTYIPSCYDGIKNQGEEEIDCGGPCAPCWTCYDGIQNQGEEGIDCGGPCIPCATCNDSIKNCRRVDKETLLCEEEIDCGGPCPPCPVVEKPEEIEKPKDYLWIFIIGIISLFLGFSLLVLSRSLKRVKRKVPVIEGIKIEDIIKIDKDFTKLGKKFKLISANEVLEVLSNIIVKIINYKYRIGVPYTKKELVEILSKVKGDQIVKELLANIYFKLYDTKYSGEEISKDKLLQFIEEAKIINKLEIQKIFPGKKKYITENNLINLFKLYLDRIYYLNKDNLDKVNTITRSIEKIEHSLSKTEQKKLRHLLSHKDAIYAAEKIPEKPPEKKESIKPEKKTPKKTTIKHSPIQIIILLLISSMVYFVLTSTDKSITGNVVFTNLIDDYMFNLTEDTLYTLYICGYDIEGDYPLTFSFEMADINKTVFDMMPTIITYHNDTCGKITFTPVETDVWDSNTIAANYSIAITVKDFVLSPDIVSPVIFNVTNVNDPPSITGYIPTSLTPTINENESIDFTYNKSGSDPDLIHLGFDYLNNTWYVNGLSTSNTNTTFNYSTGLCDAGSHNITLNVTDSYNVSTTLTWTLDVTNVNRLPVFNKSINNIYLEWQEGGNINNNITLNEYFYDTDSLECTGSNNDTLTYGAEKISVVSVVNDSKEINISIDSISSNVSYYPPDTDWFGVEVFRFYLNDGYATTYSNVTITLNITNIQDAPYFNPNLTNQTFIIDKINLYDINVTDPDNDNLTYSSNITLLGGSINDTTGLLTWSPNISQVGLHSINVTVNDSMFAESQIFTINVTGNQPPNISSIQNQEAMRGRLFTLTVTAYDPNELQNLTFTFKTYNITPAANTSLNLTAQYLNLSASTISFIPLTSNIGNYSVTVNVTDPYNLSDYTTFNLSVVEVYEIVSIDEIYPYGTPFSNFTVFAFMNTSLGNISLFQGDITSINASENTTFLFNHTSTHKQANPFNCLWYLNGALCENNSYSVKPHWIYEINFTQAGQKNVTLILDDGTYNDTFIWNISIANLNRAPVFGKKTLTSMTDFQGGTINQTNITTESGNITLGKISPTTYYTNGTYISGVIDIVVDYRINTYRINIISISWTQSLPNGTNISFRTRVANESDEINLSVWSNYYNTTGSANITNGQGGSIQFEINMTTNNNSITPKVNGVTINYEIKDDRIGGRVVTWLNLDDFFTDPDNESAALNYTCEDVSNLANLGLVINDNIVGLSPIDNGDAVFRFAATDSESETRSNDITITIELLEPPPRTVTVSGGGGGSRTKIQLVPIIEKEPEYLELIYIEPLRILPNKTILVPIILNNTGDEILREIYLSAETNLSNVFFEFSNNYILELDAGKFTKTELYITLKGSIDEYFSIKVIAEVTEPSRKDTAIIYIKPLENLTQKITNVMDLLKLNPVCRELEEIVTKAKEALNLRRYEEADALLTEAKEGCKYLIASLEEKENYLPKKTIVLKEKPIYIGAAIFILLLLLISIIPYIINKVRHPELSKKKKIKKKKYQKKR